MTFIVHKSLNIACLIFEHDHEREGKERKLSHLNLKRDPVGFCLKFSFARPIAETPILTNTMLIQT